MQILLQLGAGAFQVDSHLHSSGKIERYYIRSQVKIGFRNAASEVTQLCFCEVCSNFITSNFMQFEDPVICNSLSLDAI